MSLDNMKEIVKWDVANIYYQYFTVGALKTLLLDDEPIINILITQVNNATKDCFTQLMDFWVLDAVA